MVEYDKTPLLLKTQHTHHIEKRRGSGERGGGDANKKKTHNYERNIYIIISLGALVRNWENVADFLALESIFI